MSSKGKFWDQEQESASGSDSSEEETPAAVAVEKNKHSTVDTTNRWISDDSDDEESKRVVKAHKTKYFEEIDDERVAMRNALKKKNYIEVSAHYDNLHKALKRAKKVIATSGFPRGYARAMADLEDTLEGLTKANAFPVARRKSSKRHIPRQQNAKAFAQLKRKVPKYNTSSSIAKFIKDYRKSPDEDEDELEPTDNEDSSESEASSDEEVARPKKAASGSDSSGASGSDSSSGSSSDSDSSDSDSDSSKSSGSDSDSSSSSSSDSSKSSKSSDSDSDSDFPLDELSSDSEDEMPEASKTKGRHLWVKRAPTEAAASSAKPKAPRRAAKEQKAVVTTGKPVVLASTLADGVKTVADLRKQLGALTSVRGRKSVVSPKQAVGELAALVPRARQFGPRFEAATLMHLVTSRLDMSRDVTKLLPVAMWRSCLFDLLRVVDLMEANPSFRFGAVKSEELTVAAMSENTGGALKEAKSAGVNVGGTEAAQAEQAAQAEAAARAEAEAAARIEAETKDIVHCVGHVGGYSIRLHTELVKALRVTDLRADPQAYSVRLADEDRLQALAQRAQSMYSRIGDAESAAGMALLRMELAYYLHRTPRAARTRDARALFAAAPPAGVSVHQAYKDQIEKLRNPQPAAAAAAAAAGAGASSAGAAAGAAKTAEAAAKAAAAAAAALPPVEDMELPTLEVIEFDPLALTEEMAKLVYAHGDERAKTRALLFRAFVLAMHDEFHRARDLLFMSRLQDNINKVDNQTQVLFNRLMVQLGLAAFRAMLMTECQSCLSEVCSGGRVRELLAQGKSNRSHDKYRNERTTEQELEEKRRLEPAHMHISVELVDTCHLVASMLREVPLLSGPSHSTQSRYFSKQLESHTRDVYHPPPETYKKRIMVASCELHNGNWRKCRDLVLDPTGLSMWKEWTFYMEAAAEGQSVRDKLSQRIAEDGLRAYVMSFATVYESLSQERMAEMFELPMQRVHSLVSGLIARHNLQGRWDQTTGMLVLQQQRRTDLQNVLLSLAMELPRLAEKNEELMDARLDNAGRRDHHRGKSEKRYSMRRGRWNNNRSRSSDNRSHRAPVAAIQQTVLAAAPAAAVAKQVKPAAKKSTLSRDSKNPWGKK